MFTSGQSLETIEPATTNSMVTLFSVMRTSSSLNVSWNRPNNVCGTSTGYSVYVATKVPTVCIIVVVELATNSY